MNQENKNVISSLSNKIYEFEKYQINKYKEKIEEQKSRKFQKELDDKKLIEEIIKNKAKETITED